MGEWKQKQLSDLVLFQRGHDLPRTVMVEGEIPVAGSNGIIGFHNKATTKGPGITIGRSGNIGTPHFYETDFWAHNTVLFAKELKGDPKFVFYFLRNLDLSQFNAGSAVPTLNRNHIHEIEIQVPDVPEQKAIAEVLSSLDDKIDLLHRQNKTLESLAQTLFRQWFIEEADDSWEVVKLGDVIQTTSGGTPRRDTPEYYLNGNIDWVKSKELSGSFIFDTEEKITDEALKKSSAKLLPKNAILIAMYGATVGEFAILANPATCNQAICALIPNDNFPYTFLYSFVKHNKEYIISVAVGSAQQNVSQILIKGLDVAVSPERVSKYHSEVGPYFEKIKSNHHQIRTLTKCRDSLLPKLMSGEVEVVGN